MSGIQPCLAPGQRSALVPRPHRSDAASCPEGTPCPGLSPQTILLPAQPLSIPEQPLSVWRRANRLVNQVCTRFVQCSGPPSKDYLQLQALPSALGPTWHGPDSTLPAGGPSSKVAIHGGCPHPQAEGQAHSHSGLWAESSSLQERGFGVLGQHPGAPPCLYSQSSK